MRQAARRCTVRALRYARPLTVALTVLELVPKGKNNRSKAVCEVGCPWDVEYFRLDLAEYGNGRRHSDMDPVVQQYVRDSARKRSIRPESQRLSHCTIYPSSRGNGCPTLGRLINGCPVNRRDVVGESLTYLVALQPPEDRDGAGASMRQSSVIQLYSNPTKLSSPARGTINSLSHRCCGVTRYPSMYSIFLSQTQTYCKHKRD